MVEGIVAPVPKPIVHDLYCGLGGWAQGFLAEDYEVIGYDIEAHDYGKGGYPGKLILQDILTLHGSACKDAAVIVASPPCQEPSYRAMPWSRAKALNAIGPPLKFIALFEACFRIQREASEAAGHYIPMVVENVKGAQRWVGRAQANYGSFFLWGDVGRVGNRVVVLNGPLGSDVGIRPLSGRMKFPANCGPRMWRDRDYQRLNDGNASAFHHEKQTNGVKTSGHANMRDGHAHTRHLTNQRESDGIKAPGVDWSKFGDPDYKAVGFNVRNAQRYREEEGRKQPGISGTRKNGKGDKWFQDGAARHGSKSDSRKAASAEIAKIPFPLAQHIARCFKPSTAS